MTAKIYRVKLSKSQRSTLSKLTRSGTIKARKLKRVRILLLADENNLAGCRKDDEISEFVEVARTTVCRIRQRFVEGGLEFALSEKSRPGKPKKITGREKAKIIALACSKPPEGYARWSLRLLADRQVVLEIENPVSHTAIADILKNRK